MLFGERRFMDTLVEALIESPLLPRQLEKLHQVVAEESAHRERFYDEMTDEGTWEFINGEVIRHPPFQLRHIVATDNLRVLMSVYADSRRLGWTSGGKLLVSLTRNDYQPDVCFFRQEIAADFNPDQMHFPAPDFIAEVLSPWTSRNDRGIKRRDYAAHGVAEYWIIDPVARSVEQHRLCGDEYQLVGYWKEADTISSFAVQGFQIPVVALFDSGAKHSMLTRLIENMKMG
jgi:Uma2 family endonuclease